ncbi:hypothetical protein N7448_010464 [Penicillium atrosanguineum]|nr:hypothetical protein N7526_010393 [Penicillium atrosanguineum]KAJ5119795.1 hypothetical protein N7448_010464 [Penicillium atrosanguineum]
MVEMLTYTTRTQQDRYPAAPGRKILYHRSTKPSRGLENTIGLPALFPVSTLAGSQVAHIASMADPISIVGLITDVSTIIASLISYAKAVQSAKSDIRQLSEELFALKGILEHLSKEAPRDEPKSEQTELPDSFDRDVLMRVLQTTNEFLESLLADLETPKTKFRRLKQKLQWPFTQEETSEHLARLERVKSWLILVLTADHVSVDRALNSEISSLARSLKEDLSIRHQERNEMANQALFEWIAPVNPGKSHLRASKVQNIGTGRWFIDGYLQDWVSSKDNTEKIHFLVGKSGLGKTTLFAQTVQELTLASQHTALYFAYFYVTIGDTASQDPRNILGSLVAQLSVYEPLMLDEIRHLFKSVAQNKAHRQPIEISALENAVVKCASGTKPVLLLVDAINESSELDLVEPLLLRLAKISPNLRILVTTTAVSTSTLPEYAKTLNVGAGMMREDIDTFIQHRFKQDETLKSLPRKLKAEIEKTLLYKADGSFRWVQLSLDNLSLQRTARAMRETLHNLPGTLRETYVNTLARIAPDDQIFVREALFWLSFVKTPVTINQLNDAVVVDEGSTFFDEEMMLFPPKILLNISQGLITIDASGYVSLAHSSVKEFLTSEWIRTSSVKCFSLDPTTANATIMRRCLTYLCLDNFKSGYVPTADESYARLEEYPFLEYAAYYWAIHAADCVLGEHERSLVNHLFESKSLPCRGNFGVWVQALLLEVDIEVIEKTQPLYYAASFGMTSVIKAMIKSNSGLDINAPGGRTGATPVFIAAYRGNIEIVKILLLAGADPTIPDPETKATALDLIPWHIAEFEPFRDFLPRWSAKARFELHGYENPVPPILQGKTVT